MVCYRRRNCRLGSRLSSKVSLPGWGRASGRQSTALSSPTGHYLYSRFPSSHHSLACHLSFHKLVPFLCSNILLLHTFFHLPGFFAGRGTEDIKAPRLLLLTLLFFVSFSTFASVLGISLMALVQPGASSTTVQMIAPQLRGVNHSPAEEIRAVVKAAERANFQVDSLYNIIL